MARFTVTSTAPLEPALWATSADGEGVHTESNSPALAAVAAIQLNNTPGAHGAAVYAECRGEGAAVAAFQKNTTGPGDGIYAQTEGDGHAVNAVQRSATSDKAALYAAHIADGTAAFFKGNVIVTGDISFPGADCAEHFAIEDDVDAEPGTVMALSSCGLLVPARRAYERKVIGVIAGAGSFRPGILLDNQRQSSGRRQPVALVGKVFCKADASYGPIEVGDLLTTSDTIGHAMRASDPGRAFGAVIGKALGSLADGIGLVPAVVALQ